MALKKKPAIKKTKLKSAVVKKKVVKTTKPKVVKKAAPKKTKKDASQILVDAVVDGILEVKGKNISVLNLQNISNRVCDYFIICQADSNTQVNAIADSIQETVKKKTKEIPYKKEGFENSEWIIVDYVNVVVHIFQSQIRNYYNLESLWADAEVKEIAFE
jgi:ribosome-associated protein